MGGTSADMSVVQELAPAQTTPTTVGNLPIIVPVVSVTAIGAGGGSVVWVDGQGLPKVGPHSADAQPGPACYAAGGTEATITDVMSSSPDTGSDRNAIHQPIDQRIAVDRLGDRLAHASVAQRVGKQQFAVGR